MPTSVEQESRHVEPENVRRRNDYRPLKCTVQCHAGAPSTPWRVEPASGGARGALLYCGPMPESRAAALLAVLCVPRRRMRAVRGATRAGAARARGSNGSSPIRPASTRAEPPGRAEQRHLLIVLDGLRPDYVTPELMPNLHALGARGVVFTAHHAVYPTVTRVNAASIATGGAYPETHGLMGNAVFFPAVDATRFLSTGERENLLRIEEAEDGRLLTAPTLGERLQGAGMRLLVASAGSSGSSYLLNHTLAGGGVIHYEYALPETLGQAVRERIGAPPPAAAPNRGRNRYAVDARSSRSAANRSIRRWPSSG